MKILALKISALCIYVTANSFLRDRLEAPEYTHDAAAVVFNA